MIPEALITANEVLIAVTVFTTGFLSVRIHGEQLRLLERRDAVRDKLIEATSSGQPIRHIEPPSGGEFDLSNIGKSLLFVNLGILLMLLTIQVIASRIAGWVWKWPADAEFWFFSAVDIVETVLIIIAFVDWYAVHNDLLRDQQQRPWTRLNTVRKQVIDAIGKPIDERKRAEQLDEAQSTLMTLTQRYRTWLEPFELHVLVDWLHYGAQYAADAGLQEQVVSLLPNEPAPRLTLAHILTCAWVSSSDKSSADRAMLERARCLATEALTKARERSLPQEVQAACQEALGDTFLAAHDWSGAIPAYEAGLQNTRSGPPGHHHQRNRVKLALALIGKRVQSPLGEQDALQRANELLKAQASIVIRDADRNIIRRAPAGLRAALAVVHLLGLGVTQARATIQETVSGLNVGKDKRDPTMRPEEIHVALVNDLISLQDTSARADHSILEAMINRLDGHKSELRAVRVYEETEYTVPILARIAQSLQAEAYELLGNTSETARQRRHALTTSWNFKPLWVSQDETFTPLGMLLGGWIFLEIYNAGFCQWLDDEYRNYAGPRFLEPELDPTTSFWDYAFGPTPRDGEIILRLTRPKLTQAASCQLLKLLVQ